MTQTRSSLLRRVRDPADSDGWREFVALYEPLLLAYLRRQGLGADASDVVQDVFAKLLKALPGFDLDRQRGRFRTWLWRVSRHALADWARRHRRRARAEDEAGRRLEDFAADVEAEPEAEWLAMHRRRVLTFALERVRARSQPRTWACFEQHLLRGRPSGAIAAELGLTANAVDVNASRVLARVRAVCTEYLEELADGYDVLPG